MKGFIAVGLLALTTVSMAQTLRELSATRSGDGTMTYQGRREEVRQVQVRLDRDGDAYVRVVGERSTRSMDGRWRYVSNRQVQLTMDRGLSGRDTYVTGTVTTRGTNDFDAISLRGRSDREDFSVSFSTRDGNWNDRDPRGNYSQTYNGTVDGVGVIGFDGRRENVRRAAIRLESDRRATIDLITNEGTRTLRGRWSGRTETVATVNITEVEGRSADATAQLYFERGRFTNMRLEARRGTSLNGYFTTDRDDRRDNRNDPFVRGDSLSQTLTGTGDIEFSEDDDLRLRTMTMNLRRGGNADFTFVDTRGRSHTMSGTWRWVNDNRIRLDIDRGFNRSNLRANGEVIVDDRGRFERIEIGGNYRGGKFDIDFKR